MQRPQGHALARPMIYLVDTGPLVAALVCMSEQTRNSAIVTVDRRDFTTYRRFGRERIPLLTPD